MSDQGGSDQPGGDAPSAPHPAHRLLERVAFEPDGDAGAVTALPAATRAHVSGCPVCSAEIARLRADSARFVAGRPASAFARAV